MKLSHVQVAGIEAPVLLSRYGDVEGFCRDTEGLVSRLASIKVAAASAGLICIVQSCAGLAIQSFEAGTLWAVAGLGAVGLARLLWERLAASDMVAVQPLSSALASEAGRGRVELFWRHQPRHSVGRMGPAGAEILLNVQGSLAFRPDLLARWAGHWGYFTRRVPTLVVHARPFVALENGPAAEGLHLDAAGTVSRLPAPGLSARTAAAFETLQLRGTIFGTNRGKRTLAQLARHGELSEWLRVSPELAIALANEAWG